MTKISRAVVLLGVLKIDALHRDISSLKKLAGSISSYCTVVASATKFVIERSNPKVVFASAWGGSTAAYFLYSVDSWSFIGLHLDCLSMVLP